jgi:phosphatidylinositol kinase/protein kinase (PI-3  family)
MGGVQETLFDKVLLEGQGSPKFQYSASGALTTQELRKNYEKNMWETELQPAEKKTSCDKCISRENTTTLLALAYQKLGSS